MRTARLNLGAGNLADLQKLYDAVLNGDAKAAVAVTTQALDEGTDPLELVTKTMVSAMDRVGQLFDEEEYFVPELLLSARAMKSAMKLIRPWLAETGVQLVGRVAIGTVQGDLHDIDKNLVVALLEGSGFEVTDLGADVPRGTFVEAMQQQGAQIVCLSDLLTVTMSAIQTTIKALDQAGKRQQVKVLVGGVPGTQQYADAIGADGYGENVNTAVSLARRLCGVGTA